MKKMIPVIVLVMIIAIAAVIVVPKLSLVHLNNVNSDNHQLVISTSFYPLYFFASEIGGDRAEVKNITPAGAEPHDYDPSTQDIARIENSNMLILNGGVESWGSKMQDILAGTDVKVVTAGQGLLAQNVVEDGQNQTDPHVWLDPVLAKKEVKSITGGFVSIDPQNASYYQNNEQMLDEKLDQLDNEYKTGLKSCQQKNIVTSHAAFGYLASRYGLNQISVAGLSPDAEPSVKQLADITDFVKQNKIKYIFFESLVSPKLSQTLASETGTKTLVLDPIEGVSNNDIKQGKNYLTIMQDNLHNLQIALECRK